MTNEEKVIAFKILKFHQQHGGKVDQMEFDLEEELNESVHDVSDVLRELETLGYIRSVNDLTTRLTDKGKNFISFDNEERENQKAKQEQNLNYEKLTLEVEDLRNKYFDYPDTKKLAISAKRWSIAASVGTVLTAILLLLQWICSKNG